MSWIPNRFLSHCLACGLIIASPLCAAPTPTTKAPKTIKIANENQWKAYRYEESGFSIELPKAPEHAQQAIQVPKTDLTITYETFLSEPSDHVVYVVSVWNYPSQVDMSNPEVNLQDGFKGMLAALPGSEVEQMEISETDGFDSLEFLVKNEDIFFQGKLILVYNTLYQVFTVYKNSENMKEDYKRFIGSFELINPAQHRVSSQEGKVKDVKVKL